MNLKELNTILYFAYGHNTNSSIMMRRAPGAELIPGHAYLNNFRLSFRRFANIENHDGARVYGMVWRIDKKALAVLDDDEGFHKNYNRIPVEVYQNDKVYKCTTYIMDPDNAYRGLPSRRYLKSLIDGYTEHHLPINQITMALHEAKDHIDH